MIARDQQRLDDLRAEIPDSCAYSCDLTDREKLDEVLADICNDFGTPKIVIHNAVGGALGDVLSIDPEVLQRNFQINTMALLQIIQTLAPRMVEAGEGCFLATGNTSAYRGRDQFAGFAPTKAAQRILMESAARHLGPKGICHDRGLLGLNGNFGSGNKVFPFLAVRVAKEQHQLNQVKMIGKFNRPIIRRTFPQVLIVASMHCACAATCPIQTLRPWTFIIMPAPTRFRQASNLPFYV